VGYQLNLSLIHGKCVSMGYIIECKINELRDEAKKFQDIRQRCIEEANLAEVEMMKLIQQIEKLKRQQNESN
jgi:3-dehydroquinate synthetase